MKKHTYKSAYAFCEGRELILNTFRRRIFPIKTEEKGQRVLAPKEMLQRLAIALGQIKASNTSKTLLNEIRSIVFLCIDQKIKRILKIVKHLIITSYYLISR